MFFCVSDNATDCIDCVAGKYVEDTGTDKYTQIRDNDPVKYVVLRRRLE